MELGIIFHRCNGLLDDGQKIVTRRNVQMKFDPNFTGLHSSPKERQLQKSCVSFGEECIIHKVGKYIWCLAIFIPIVSFLTDFGILIIHECIPVQALVVCIIVCLEHLHSIKADWDIIWMSADRCHL